MERSLGRILLLLAGSGLSHKEIREAVVELQGLPPSQLADVVLHLRRGVRDPIEVADSVLGGGRRPDPSGDVRRRVEFLLREEAGLTVNRAASELLASLKGNRRGVFDTMKPPNRESFYNWLHRVLARIGPSELLHHATLVRNKYVHGTDRDWPLLPR